MRRATSCLIDLARKKMNTNNRCTIRNFHAFLSRRRSNAGKDMRNESINAGKAMRDKVNTRQNRISEALTDRWLLIAFRHKKTHPQMDRVCCISRRIQANLFPVAIQFIWKHKQYIALARPCAEINESNRMLALTILFQQASIVR